MADAIDRHGVWHRSGMDGGVSGLDWPAALASLPTGLDREFVKRLLSAAEAAYVPAWWDYAESLRKTKGKG